MHGQMLFHGRALQIRTDLVLYIASRLFWVKICHDKRALN